LSDLGFDLHDYDETKNNDWFVVDMDFT